MNRRWRRRVIEVLVTSQLVSDRSQDTEFSPKIELPVSIADLPAVTYKTLIILWPDWSNKESITEYTVAVAQGWEL